MGRKRNRSKKTGPMPAAGTGPSPELGAFLDKIGMDLDRILEDRQKEFEAELEAQLEESFARLSTDLSARIRAESSAMIRDAFEEEDRRKRRVDALWNQKSILRAARDEIAGEEPQSDQLADAFKQEVMNLQWIVAERGPRVEELLANPQARDLFTPEKINSLFGALDKDPKEVKAEILSDILTLEQAQINSWGGDVDKPEVKATRALIRELLVFWGPKLAREYWAVVVGNPEEFNPIDEEQEKRFSDLLE